MTSNTEYFEQMYKSLLEIEKSAERMIQLTSTGKIKEIYSNRIIALQEAMRRWVEYDRIKAEIESLLKDLDNEIGTKRPAIGDTNAK